MSTDDEPPATRTAAQLRVLDAAVQAFSEQGFGGASTRDIAGRAGRSQAAVYIHYASKEALLYAISLQGHRDALERLMSAHDSGESPAERVHRMVLEFSLWHMENAKLARVVQYELHALTRAHRSRIITLRRRTQQAMARAVRAAVKDEGLEVSDVEATARAMLSLCIDLVRWFDPALSRDPHAVAEFNAHLAMRILGAGSHHPIPTTAQGRGL